MSNSSTSFTTVRYHGLDLLRAIALLLGLFFHAAIPFFAGPKNLQWIIYYDNNFWIFNWIADFIHSFRMPLFFILAGFFSSLLLSKYGLKLFIRMRFRKLVIPFIASMVFLTPLMIYQFIAAGHHGERITLSTYPVFHLWFLEVLIIITSLSIFFYLVKGTMQNVIRTTHLLPLLNALKRSGQWQYAILLALLLFLGWSPFPGDQFSDSFSIIQSPTKILYYSIYFFIGWRLYNDRILFDALRKYFLLNLCIGFISVVSMCGIRYWLFYHSSSFPIEIVIFGNFTSTLAAIHLSVGFFGLFISERFKQNAFIDYLVRASYWTYLIHLPVMFFVQVKIASWQIDAMIKYSFTVFISFLFCSFTFSTYEQISRAITTRKVG